jgi:hypothetical protein
VAHQRDGHLLLHRFDSALLLLPSVPSASKLDPGTSGDDDDVRPQNPWPQRRRDGGIGESECMSGGARR